MDTKHSSTMQALASRWRAEAETLRARYHDDRGAAMCEVHARELEEAERAQDIEQLTLTQASLVSGYSTSHLRALIASKQLPNVGAKHRPRVLRCQLPKKCAPACTGRGRTRRGPKPAIEDWSR